MQIIKRNTTGEHQKFIILSNGDFVYGCVNLHKQLLREGEIAISGGYWEQDPFTEDFKLYGKSEQFGEFTVEQVKNVPQSSILTKEERISKLILENTPFILVQGIKERVVSFRNGQMYVGEEKRLLFAMIAYLSKKNNFTLKPIKNGNS